MIDMRPWLILGGYGQLGTALQKELTNRNIAFQAYSSTEIDIRDFINVKNKLFSLNPRVIINCAGWTNVNKAEEYEKEATLINAYAAGNLAKIAQQLDSVLVQISSDYIFSGDKNSPYSVDDLADPVNAYGRSKAFGEKLILDQSITKLYIFRTAWLYSEFGKNFVKIILQNYIKKQFPIKVVNDQTGSPTCAFDLSFQIVESVVQGIPFGIYHAVNLGQATWYDLAKAALENLNFDTNVIKPIKYAEYESNVVRPRNSSLDMSKWENTTIPQLKIWPEALSNKIQDIFNRVESEYSNEI